VNGETVARGGDANKEIGVKVKLGFEKRLLLEGGDSLDSGVTRRGLVWGRKRAMSLFFESFQERPK
jgi:hypothetical protein